MEGRKQSHDSEKRCVLTAYAKPLMLGACLQLAGRLFHSTWAAGFFAKFGTSLIFGGIFIKTRNAVLTVNKAAESKQVYGMINSCTHTHHTHTHTNTHAHTYTHTCTHTHTHTLF